QLRCPLHEPDRTAGCAGGAPRGARGLRMARVRCGRRSDKLRSGHGGRIPLGWRVYWPHSQGRRSPGAAGHQSRALYQPQNCQGAWNHIPALAARSRRQGDRVSAQMMRREFIALLGGVAAAWPLAARAQQPAKLPTIGYLGTAAASAWAPWTAAFVQRLHELGWTDGRTVAIQYRWAEGRAERSAELAAELARLKVDVIVTGG